MKILLCALLGLGVGSIGGMVGIGGGVLLVPALTWLFDMEPRKAAGVTLAVLAVPVTLPGVVQYYAQGRLAREDLLLAACIAAAFGVGTFTGAYLQRWVGDAPLRLLFGLLMLFVAVRMIVHADLEATSAAAGLVATVLAWLGYLGLRALGRRHAPPPRLGEQIRREAEESRANPIDYYI